jgi:hypothetical protein
MLSSPEPTAEQIVQATEAAYLLNEQADLGSVAGFMSLDVAAEYQRRQVEHALMAAESLRLAIRRGRRGYVFSPLSPLIVKGGSEDKRALFRVHLEQYEPFRLFIGRLMAGNQPAQAARQVCAVYSFADDPAVAWRAFESWGTYAGSLVRGEDGQFAPAGPPGSSDSLRQRLDVLYHQEQDARQFILEHLGQEAFEFIEGDVREALSDAIVMLTNNNEPAHIVLRVSNTYENFLRLVGYRRVDLHDANGIIQIGNRLKGRRLIAQKHLGAVQLIGNIRNAIEHGGDPDEANQPWQITPLTVRLMILAVLSSIHSIALYSRRRTLEL